MEDKVLINTTTKITVEVFGFRTLQKLTDTAERLNRTWNELFNVAIERLLNDIELLADLKSNRILYKSSD